jgi:hypothetical protein
MTKNLILENLDQLPENLHQEVLDFVMFLRFKEEQIEAKEDGEDLEEAKLILLEDGFIPLSEVKKELGL